MHVPNVFELPLLGGHIVFNQELMSGEAANNVWVVISSPA